MGSLDSEFSLSFLSFVLSLSYSPPFIDRLGPKLAVENFFKDRRLQSEKCHEIGHFAAAERP